MKREWYVWAFFRRWRMRTRIRVATWWIGIPRRELNRVGVYAMRLVDIAWADERDLWDHIVRELREPNLYRAAALLAQLGYDMSASELARVWECECGERLNSRAAFEEHEAAPVHVIASAVWECRCGLTFIEPSWLVAHQSKYASSINDHRARVHRE